MLSLFSCFSILSSLYLELTCQLSQHLCNLPFLSGGGEEAGDWWEREATVHNRSIEIKKQNVFFKHLYNIYTKV